MISALWVCGRTAFVAFPRVNRADGGLPGGRAQIRSGLGRAGKAGRR